MTGARVAIMPLPPSGPDGALYAPFSPAPIQITATALGAMESSAHLVVGAADASLRHAARLTGVTVHEYEGDTELMLLRAPAIAEGAIAVAIEHSDVTLHGTGVAVMGFGRIGQRLVSGLLGMRAVVHVFARRPEARASAWALGAHPHAMDEMATVFEHVEIVFNTVPAHVITAAEIATLPPRSLVVDLAAPPGGVDLNAARELGHIGIWARGLGGCAPRTVAASQWMGICRITEAALRDRPSSRAPHPRNA